MQFDIACKPRKVYLQDYNEVMELPRVDPPIWVDSNRMLRSLAETIANESRIAIDTESNSLFAYQEKVCLVQISTTGTDYLIDPFKISDFLPLAPVFANPAVEKIFHAAEYDLICLKRDYHLEFDNLFDTMLAARILGLPEVGLGPLLANRFEVMLDKRYQRANWGQRPLTEAMLAYAALDTHYLFILRDSLYAELDEHGLLELAKEDFRFISKAEGHGQNGSNTNCWKVAGAHPITPHQAAILDKLCIYRDEQARKSDLPHFKVLSNQLMIDLCSTEITSLDDLAAAPGMSPKIFQRHGERLLDAIKNGQTAEPIYKPRRPRLDDDYLQRMDKLKNWRKVTAKELKVESDIVLPKDLMESIAYHNPHTSTELSDLMREFPYRSKRYNQKILETLNMEVTE
jgi:ribonuclease D